LMTDGVPDGGPEEQAQCTSAATTELSTVTTFAVGVGPFPSPDTTGIDGYDPAFLGTLAQAGGAAPAGCNPIEENDPSRLCHFQITPGGKSAQELAQEFANAINRIRGQVASCDFVLDKSGGTVDPTKVNVVYRDQAGQEHVIVQDPLNGWTYDNPTNPSKV